MKRNITINLYGTLYNIDEDAYDLLRDYERNMRQYYSRQPEGEEICDDIEHRIAELLSELKAQGINAISIEHVQDIIQRIGNPNDMDDSHSTTEDVGRDETTEKTAPNLGERLTSELLGRALYRDADDKILGGVMSGLTKYIGNSDPTPLRIVLIILLFLSFSIVAVIYLLLWALLPEARTAEDRLRMRGERVTAHSITEETMRNSSSSNGTQPRQSLGRSLLVILGWIFKAALLAGGLLSILFFLGGMLTFGSLAIGIGTFSTITPFPDPQVGAFFSVFSPIFLWILTAGFAMGLTWSCIGLFGVARLFIDNVEPLPRRTRMGLTAAAIIAFILMISAFAYCIGNGMGAFIKVQESYTPQSTSLTEKNTEDCAQLTADSTYQFFVESEDSLNTEALQIYYYTNEDSTRHFVKIGVPFTATGGNTYWGCDDLPQGVAIHIQKLGNSEE